jgi:hypothetical protein
MGNKLQIKKVSWWHERLADHMIANPQHTMKDIAVLMNCHVQTLYIIKNSDVFIDYWRQRSQAHSEAVTTGIKDKAFASSEMALELLMAKLEKDGELMTVPALLDVVDVTMKRFGYNNDKNAPGPVINMNFGGLVTAEQLAEARDRMREKVIDLQPEAKEEPDAA